MKRQPTIVEHTEYHHLPGGTPDIDCCGMTLRSALSELRRVDWGDIGGTHRMMMSDGTSIAVELRPASDNSWVMASQRCVRYAPRDERIATYPIAE